MKKIISLILTVAMLLSITTFVAPVSAEQTREEFLNTPTYNYVDLSSKADVDAYASYADITDYAKFNKSITGSTSDHFATTTYNSETVFAMLPSKTYSGAPITGTEGYYFKGFYSKKLVESKKQIASYVMLADDLLEENGTVVTGYRYPVDSNATPKVIHDGTKTRTTSSKTVKASHVVSRTTENGKKYAVISNNGIQHKIGPVDGSDYSANSVYLSTADPTINVGATGKTLSLLVGTHQFTTLNYTATDTAVGVAPKASMNKVTVTYANGHKDIKYFVMTNAVANKNVSDAELTIVYAPKKDIWTADDLYGANKVTAKALSNANSAEHGIVDVSALTVDDIIFKNPDILMTQSANVASWINNRQDACANDNGQRVTMANIALEDQEVESFTVNKFFNYIAEKIPTSIPVGTSATQVRQAFIPVTVKGASEDYDYFAYVAATTDYSLLLGATVVGGSLQDDIDAIEKRIEALDTPYNSEQKVEIAEIKNAIESLKTQGVLESDFEDALITKLNKLYVEAEEEIKTAQIASVESKITNMAFKYISSMREEVEGIKAEYDALIASGILSSEFNEDLMAKFTKVYDVYVMSADLEDKVAGWSEEYLYTMYDEVKAAKTLAEGLKENESAGDDVVDAKVVETIDNFYTLATDGVKIDTDIDSLNIIYSKDDLEKIVEIKATIDEFKSKGGTDKGLANAEIFNSIYTAAKEDLLQRDIDIVVEKIEALPELYTATVDNDIAAIQADIAVIEGKGGAIPTEAATKLAGLITQRDEAPAYVEFNLPYNKDVIESLARYQDQFRDKGGNYVKDSSNHFVNQLPLEKQWTFAAFLTGTSTLVEEDMVSKLGVDLATNKATIKGVPYQFGKIKTTVDGKVDAENNSLTSEISSTITVDVPNNAYSKLHTAMWAQTEGAGITVKYVYADGSVSEEQNVKKIAGYRQELSVLYTQNPTYYKVLNNDSKATIKYYRAYMPQYDTAAPGGGYGLAIGDHILTPDDKKILDKIEFSFATKDAHIFAMTGQIANSVLLNKVLTEAVDSFDTTAETNIRAVLEGCTNIMASLDEKEVPYDAALKTAVAENKNIFVAIESITAYTDLDNMTFTVKFTGPVALTSITKALFAVTKNGGDFADYELVPVEENGEIREVKVVIKNDLDYESTYELTISREVAGVSGKTILTDTVKAYDSKPAVDAEITIENAAGTAKLTNNMTGSQEVTAIVAVYDANNSMVAKYLINKELASGETVSQPVAFDLKDGQKIECLILDSLTNCKKIYNTYIFE